MSKKNVSIPALSASVADHSSFLTILAAILVGLNGQPNISLLLPPLQALLQNAAGQPAAEAPATAKATATATATADSSAVTDHPGRNVYVPANIPAQVTYYDWLTTDTDIRFRSPLYRALASRLQQCAWFPHAFDLETNCRSIAALKPDGDELIAFVRSWECYSHQMRYIRRLNRLKKADKP